ncbi:MAG: LysE family translocator [Chloroflexota bacterium]
MIDTNTLLLFSFAVFVLIITPGPDMIFVASNSLATGWRGGLASIFGVATGAYVHILGTAFGITAILQTSELAYDLVRWGGALYLAWIGLKFFFSRTTLVDVNEANAHPLPVIYRDGILTNLLNPKAALFTVTFLPQFVDPSRGPIWVQMLLLGLVLVAIMIAIEIPIALSGGKAGVWLAKRPSFNAWLNKIVGGTLISLAIYVFLNRKLV